MSGTRVADVLVETLIAAGIPRIYGVAGDSLNGVTDAIRTRPQLAWIHTRHEESAAFAAAAEAQLRGRLAACAGSCGPGNLHLINGLFDAHRSRAPVLALASQIPSREVGSGYFQETHPERLFRDCSHFCEVATEAEQIPGLVESAIRTAVAREGVAVVVISGDVLLREAVEAARPLPLPSAPSAVVPPSAELEALANRLNAAPSVTILAGIGAASAREELFAVADRLRAPIVHTLRGKEALEHDNPFDVGMTGLLGFASGYRAMEAADTVLLLGTDFPYRQFYPSRAHLLQVDLRGEQIGRRAAVELGVVGDVRSTLAALLPRLAARTDSAHLEGARADYQKARRGLDELAADPAPGGKIHPQYVVRLLDELAGPDAIFACDVGTPTVWAARYLHLTGRRRLLGSFVHGSMANALPQAIGAQLSAPDRPVITLSGDGGLAMLLGDLLTLRQHALPVKVVVFRNDSLGFVTLEMQAAGLLDFATSLTNPDFAGIARAAGMLGLAAHAPEEVRPMLAQALAHPGPALVEVTVDREELVVPPKIRAEMVKGFGLFVLKAVLSGRGAEVEELARANWFR